MDSCLKKGRGEKMFTSEGNKIETVSLKRAINGKLSLGSLEQISSLNDAFRQGQGEETLIIFKGSNNDNDFMLSLNNLDDAEKLLNVATSAFHNVCKRTGVNVRKELIARFPIYAQAFS